MANSFENQIEEQQLQRQQQEGIYKAKDMDRGRPVDYGYSSLINEGTLRIARIHGFAKPLEGYDPRDLSGHINPNQGTCALSYENSMGGYQGNTYKSGKTKTTTDGRSINPEECTGTGYATNSGMQNVRLSSPAMWTGSNNWCGINYLPPVDSRVITGPGIDGVPQILAYLPGDYKTLRPILQAGETCIKGFGNNYIHFRTSDKIDIHASSSSSAYDYDDPNKEKQNEHGSTLWLRFNANDCQIKLTATGESEGSALVVSDGAVTISTGTCVINARGSINMSAGGSINMSAPTINQN